MKKKEIWAPTFIGSRRINSSSSVTFHTRKLPSRARPTGGIVGPPMSNIRSETMPDIILPFDKTKDPALSRRGFGALSLGAGATVATSALAARSIVETDVVIKTADGNCDA